MTTTNKSLVQPANASDVNTWDVPVNANMTAIDTALGGLTTLNAVGASGVTALTLVQYTPPNIAVTGALSASVNYQLPSGVGGVWSVFNGTSNAFTITLSSAGGGTSVTIPQGYRMLVVCDGANVTAATTYAPVLSSYVMQHLGASSGYVSLAAPAASGSQTFYLPAADGTAGQVLTTNGSGQWGWASLSGISLAGTNTWTGPQTFSGSSSVIAAVFSNIAEVVTISATAATGTINLYTASQSVLYYTANASANWVLNVAHSAGTTLNAALSTGESITVAFLVQQGTTAYYSTSLQIDGVTTSVNWQGGGAPSAGHASGIDAYTYTIIKTGSAAYTVLGTLTQF